MGLIHSHAGRTDNGNLDFSSGTDNGGKNDQKQMEKEPNWDYYLFNAHGELLVSRGDEDTRNVRGKVLARNLPWNEHLDEFGEYDNKKVRVKITDLFRGPVLSPGNPDVEPVDDPSRMIIPNPFPIIRPGMPRPDSIPWPPYINPDRSYRPQNIGSAGPANKNKFDNW